MVASPTSERSALTIIASQTGRRAVRSGVAWGAIFGVVVASSAISYTKIYTTQADRDGLAAAFGSNHATAALFGPAPNLQTVAGFTVFKSLMTIMVLGALWGLLTSTRLLRGEEDAGRWELFLTGQSTRRGATAQALVGLGAGVLALFLVTAIITVLTGQDSSVGYSVGDGVVFRACAGGDPSHVPRRRRTHLPTGGHSASGRRRGRLDFGGLLRAADGGGRRSWATRPRLGHPTRLG